MRERYRQLLRSESGESLIAFAFSTSVLLGFLLGVIEMSMAFYTYQMISECAREGTRYAIVHGSTCETSAGKSCEVTATTAPSGSGLQTVNSYAASLGYPNPAGGTIVATTTYPGTSNTEAPGQMVQVTVTYTYPYKIPFVTNKSLSMSSTSEMTIVQ